MKLRNLCFLCFLCCVSDCFAQQMSFDELAHQTLANNKDLQAAREALHQAEARLAQARLRPNPSVDVANTTDAIFSNEGDGGFAVTFSQPFELGGKRFKRTKAAETAIEVSKAEIADAQRQLLGRLRSLFADALGASARLDVFQRLDQLNQQTVSVMNVRLRAGDASELDSRLLQAQSNQIRAQRAVAENQLDGLLLQIRSIAGLAVDAPIVLNTPQASPDVAETEQAVIMRALQNRPDLRAARLREQLGEEGIELAKSQVIPNIAGSIR